VTRRAVDVAVSGALLVLSAPVLAAAMAAIRLESRGHPLYRQRRIGRDGRPFDVLKLRTMVDGAEHVGAGLAVDENDSRITRVGALLRRTSLDELPNLLNVLRGEMSLIGPRPTVPVQVERYTPRQRGRLAIRPGITGWAQVNGRASLPWSERIELDLYYIEHRSLALDLRILWRTLAIVLGGGGIYKGRTGGWEGGVGGWVSGSARPDRLARPAVGSRLRARAPRSAGERRPMADPPAILFTGVGKRYDIVACFAQLTTTVAVDPNPLAPAQYAAHVRAAPPPIADPEYVPFLAQLCERHAVGAVLPLTDLDIEVLARGRADGLLPALVPSPEVARATYDKYEAHLLLSKLGLPSPPTVLPEEEPDGYPVMVKPRRGSGARSIHLARDRAEKDFFVRYVADGRDEWDRAAHGRGGPEPIPEPEPVMVQRAMSGPELSIDCLGDLDGRCLNAIPRTMLESRGGESIKGGAIRDVELVELGRRVMEALRVRGPATIQVFRDPEIGLGITDVNTRFGGAFPAPTYAALPGRTYPELIVRMAAGETIAPHVGEFEAGRSFTRYYWQLELDEQLRPTGREIVPGGVAGAAVVRRG
jgi:carbamoyl-phosphate synthase large subunit